LSSFWIPFRVSFLGMVIAFWLGSFMVTHNPRFPITRVTALTNGK
jgi:hypothetical protein